MIQKQIALHNHQGHDPNRVAHYLLGGKKLMGAIMGMNHFPVDLPRLVDFYLRGLLDLDTIIAERIGLEDINAGFDKLREGHSARSIVMFD